MSELESEIKEIKAELDQCVEKAQAGEEVEVPIETAMQLLIILAKSIGWDVAFKNEENPEAGVRYLIMGESLEVDRIVDVLDKSGEKVDAV